MKILVSFAKGSVDKPVDSVEKLELRTAIYPISPLFSPIFFGLNSLVYTAKYHKIYVTETAFRGHNFSIFCEKVGIQKAPAEAWRAFSIFLQKSL